MRRKSLIPAVGFALVQAACTDSRTPTDVRAPRDVASADRTVNGESGKVVSIFDACDPTTFAQNGVSCTRPGGVTFDQFVAQITQNQKAGAWRFAPSELHVKVGETFMALNRGGETHTFTEVDHFGGGMVQFLNDLSGNPVEVDECKTPATVNFLAPGQSFVDVADDEGTELYQCCIHPWMRVVITKKG
jgi:plastocyanin